MSLNNTAMFAVTPVEAQEASVDDGASIVRPKQVVAGATVETTVRDYFKDIPVMARIAWCESKYYHINPTSGHITRGLINQNDIGVMQINETYHGKAAKVLGIDLYSLDGNLEYARYLYDKEGTRPWNSSKGCWGGTAAIAQK